MWGDNVNYLDLVILEVENMLEYYAYNKDNLHFPFKLVTMSS